MASQPQLFEEIEDLSEHMSPRLRILARMIGQTRAITLAEHYGGTYLYIPECATRDHRLAQLIGEPALRILAGRWGSLKIYIPKGFTVQTARLYQAMRSEREQGASQSAIARKYGVSKRTVQKACAAGD